MASYNRVMLMGNLTRDIEMKYTAGGLAVSDMGLAVNDRRKNKDGQWVDDVCYVTVTLFGRTAEVASEYLSKGSPVFVEGHLKFDSWEKDGQKRSKLSVVCDRMQMIGGREGGGSSQSRSDQSRSDGKPEPTANLSTTKTSNHHVAESSDDYEPPQGRGDAAPTGDGAGYDDADIPF